MNDFDDAERVKAAATEPFPDWPVPPVYTGPVSPNVLMQWTGQ